MLLVESSVGSRELLDRIRALGVPAELAPGIDSDFQWIGNGEDGPVLVGVERKTIQDFLNSMRERRLEGVQLPKMVNCYDRIYLIIEGTYRKGLDGWLEIPVKGGEWRPAKGNHRYSESDTFLCRLEEMWGVRAWRTFDERETAAVLANRYMWWQEEWLDHRPLRTVYAPEPERKNERRHKPLGFQEAPSLAEKWAAQLPGVDGRAVEIAARFKSARHMAMADEAEWLQLTKGLRTGKKSVETIVREIEREK